MNRTFYTIVQASRPKFIVLAPICVLLGIAAAIHDHSSLNLMLTFSCLLIAVLAHISVNLLNEYHDAKSGLDERTKRTAFSGGSGALQENPRALGGVYYTALVCTMLLVLFGIYVVSQVNLVLSILGFLGLSIIFLYTPWLNKKPWLCLFSPGLGFGLLMVLGTYVALTNSINMLPVLLSVTVFCLVNNLLLINQYPDAEADKTVGREHFVIAYGYELSALVYLVFTVLAYFTIVLMIAMGMLSKLALIAIIALPLSLLIAKHAKNFDSDKFEDFLPFMGLNVLLTICIPLILVISLFIANWQSVIN